jgi:hypothetical protein
MQIKGSKYTIFGTHHLYYGHMSICVSMWVSVYYIRKVSWSGWIVFKMDQQNISVRVCVRVEVLICDIYIVRK